jgi:LuxR family maltose regulon positive regulatory protein
MAWSHYLLGALTYETNRLPEAVHHFDQVVALHQETSALALNDAMLGAALARQALGRADEAAALLDEAEEFILSTNSIPFLTNLHSLRARIALMQGDLGSAQAWTHVTPMRMNAGPLMFLEVPPLTAARVLLADPGKKAAQEALALVSEVEERCRREHNFRYLIAVLSLQAVAMAKLGRQRPALERLENSVDLARRSGFVRTFVDLGPPMAGLLHSLASRTPHTAYVDRLLAAFAAAGTDGGGQPQSNRIEPLTPRELQILPLLQRRYSNEEIAGELGISILTVKRHTGSLYAKLDVSGRKDAVRRAATLGLLSPGD